jgi:hypothetical protein
VSFATKIMIKEISKKKRGKDFVARITNSDVIEFQVPSINGKSVN